jgi:hypothetical protein
MFRYVIPNLFKRFKRQVDNSSFICLPSREGHLPSNFECLRKLFESHPRRFASLGKSVDMLSILFFLPNAFIYQNKGIYNGSYLCLVIMGSSTKIEVIYSKNNRNLKQNDEKKFFR